jgi:D-3-phosphoglycerate dehydrogenase
MPNAQILWWIDDADAIHSWQVQRWDAATLRSLPRSKVLMSVGVGFDNVDLQFSVERGTVACNAPDYGTHDVADHAMARSVRCPTQGTSVRATP